MASPRKDFRLIKQCQKLCSDITEMQGTADKKYRYTICQDVRKKSEDVIHYIRKANGFPAGNDKRMELQIKADELLEEIKDLLWIVGKLLNTGARKEAKIELSLEDVQNVLHRWMEYDQKISVSHRQEVVHKLAWNLYKAKKTYEIIKEYASNNQNERTIIALDESKARLRIASNDYTEAIKIYDKAVKQLRTTQDKYHKDDSVLSEILKEIKDKDKTKVLKELSGKNFKPSDNTVKEKNALENMANEKILKDFGDDLSEGTKEKLKSGF